MIIVIDGPAGSGKSTTARALADRLGANYLDTGAMYRAITLKALDSGVHLEDESGLRWLAERTEISFTHDSTGRQRVLLDGKDVTDEIRSPRVSDTVSIVSAVPAVRHAMVTLQQEVGQQAKDKELDLVAEGRDMGTVVFPHADVKVYLTASPQVRARRRHRDMADLGHEITVDEITESIVERDRLDSTREVGPLRKAHDAIPIDTSDMSPEEVVDEILRICGKG